MTFSGFPGLLRKPNAQRTLGIFVSNVAPPGFEKNKVANSVHDEDFQHFQSKIK